MTSNHRHTHPDKIAAQIPQGIIWGALATLSWAFYNIGSSLGRAHGFGSYDLTALRFAGGAAVLLVLLAFFKGTGQRATWRQLIIMVLTAGPPFALLVTAGFGFAPLSHALVLMPGTTMLVATLLTVILDHEQISKRRVFGMAMLIIGLITIASDKSSNTSTDNIWLGDLCFASAGTLWGVFTWALGRWKLDALRASGQIALISTLLFLPPYLLWAQLPEQPLSAWTAQFIYQGLLGGALAVVFFSSAVRILGSQKAGLFAALVPPTAIIVAIPMMGSLPTKAELMGIAFASVGLMAAIARRRKTWPTG